MSIPAILDKLKSLFENTEQFAQELREVPFVLPSYCTFRSQIIVIFELAMLIASPCCGIPIHSEISSRLIAFSEFIDKHKHLINPFCAELANYLDNIKPYEIDIDHVPAIRLNFWPKILNPFIDRITKNRPDVLEPIMKSIVFVVPKWSKITPEHEAHFEFRYSFSDIEKTIAQLRSDVEKSLNKIAKSLYYEILSKANDVQVGEQYLPSYFAKTTALWICEQENLTELYQNEPNKDIFFQSLAEKWRQYAIRCLKDHCCKHYFTEDINILQLYEDELMKLALEKLENWTYRSSVTPPRDYFEYDPMPSEESKIFLQGAKKFVLDPVAEFELKSDIRELENKYFLKTNLSDINVTRYLETLSLVPLKIDKWINYIDYLQSYRSNEQPLRLITVNLSDVTFSHFIFTLPVVLYILFQFDIYFDTLELDENRFITTSDIFIDQMFNMFDVHFKENLKTLDPDLCVIANAGNLSKVAGQEINEKLRDNLHFKGKDIDSLSFDLFSAEREQQSEPEYSSLQEFVMDMICDVLSWIDNKTTVNQDPFNYLRKTLENVGLKNISSQLSKIIFDDIFREDASNDQFLEELSLEIKVFTGVSLEQFKIIISFMIELLGNLMLSMMDIFFDKDEELKILTTIGNYFYILSAIFESSITNSLTNQRSISHQNSYKSIENKSNNHLPFERSSSITVDHEIIKNSMIQIGNLITICDDTVCKIVSSRRLYLISNM
ncbi:unnamed protein product [Didymodactylos carnosus]|uniref:Uncharacterized protein n=1 Tax=Didymodactylos carnosus TaxID=1234261 RepID=A0A8S2Q409_9BILA|nr:unnamed protein product [Didymodactylos carnosus]CAF4079846.1 unnamed protein product [Didymodactylos carnosus]